MDKNNDEILSSSMKGLECGYTKDYVKTKIGNNYIDWSASFYKNGGANKLRVPNLLYDTPMSGSCLNNLLLNKDAKFYNGPAGRTKLYGEWLYHNTHLGFAKTYNCVGATVGKGTTIEEAYSNMPKELTDSSNSYNSASYVDENENYTSVLIDNSFRVVCIAFYYEYETELKDYPAPSDIRTVYVRHIDVSDMYEINNNNIEKAINSGKTLEGLGFARKNGDTDISKEKQGEEGYQEVYKIYNSDTLEVYKDPNGAYECIGSNMMLGETTTGKTGLNDAKNKMKEKLDSADKFDSNYTVVRPVSKDDINDVVLIDFYYKSAVSNKLLDREKVGRLAFYTLDDTSNFKNTVNNHTSTNTKKYDTIPSGESLRMSIDNAYTYMLGAINISEQTKEGVYEFDYTIKQPYKVEYTDYWLECSTHGKQSDYISDINKGSYGKCGEITGYDENGNALRCQNELVLESELTTLEGTVDKTFTYKIPYKYTYYKIKNMRVYSINNIKLFDGYNENNVLPLFDGKTYTINPSAEYLSSIANATFYNSEDDESCNATEKELASTFEYEMAEGKDYTKEDVRRYANNMITPTLNTLTHSTAASIKRFNAGEVVNFDSKEDYLKATLYIKNDNVSFNDEVTNKTVYIVGDSSGAQKEAKLVVDLSIYTKDISNGVTEYSKDDVKVQEVKTEYPNVTNSYTPKDNITNVGETGGVDYFETKELKIPTSRLNGKRYSYGSITYSLLTNNNVLNFDVSEENAKDGEHDWERTTVRGNLGSDFLDTEMDKIKNKDNPDKISISPGTLTSIVWEYGKDVTKDSDANAIEADIVDVFTPVSFSTSILENNKKDTKVDHTTTNNGDKSVQIQKNSRFTVQINAENHSTYSNLKTTSKYISQYYIKFDFDVQDIKITDTKGTNRSYNVNYVSAGEWIGPIYCNKDNKWNDTVSISAYALEDQQEAAGLVNQESNEYEVRAFAINIPTSLKNYILNKSVNDLDNIYINGNTNYFSGTTDLKQPLNAYYDQKNILGHSGYAAYENVTTENISRVYDFKVTDLKDIDWKTIFRKTTTTTTNVHSGKAYYSGINKWNIYTTAYNEMLERDVSEIGVTKKQILPLGPYKHTSGTYTKAPKLGYRFSFDLKTTGANPYKRVVITPSFYYISKDGKTYNSNIKLYYKNSSNKYVSIDNYNLYFVPDDGYRLTFDESNYRFSSSTMKKTSVGLIQTVNSKKCIVLTDDMMQKTDNGFIQIWYGEYKLPNSTIAVAKGPDGKYNVNTGRLTNGYIGVKFDIEVVEYTNSSKNKISKVLNYSQNNNNASIETNTSQWDYEGYLGVEAGEEYNGSITLENGVVWNINNDRYNEIKGTVILYDTDTRASSDYD